MDLVLRDKSLEVSNFRGLNLWPTILALGLRGGFSSTWGLPKKIIFIREEVFRTCVLKFLAHGAHEIISSPD
jgi:hypothetical protein